MNKEDDIGQDVIGDRPTDLAERQRADTHHDVITWEMWIDYQEEL